MNNLYPIFLKLEHRPALVVGAGKVALQKIEGLLEAGAEVTVIAPSLSRPLQALADQRIIEVIRREYQEDDVSDYALIIAATDDPSVQRKVFTDAHRWNVPINTVDQPELCDFYLGSVFKNGELKIAVSTNGKSPTLGKMIRDKLKAEFSEGYPDVIERVGKIRDNIREAYPDFESRKSIHEQIVETESKRLEERWAEGNRRKETVGRRIVGEDRKPETGGRRNGRAFLVGAGPGDPELITVKGIRILQSADVVIYDALVSDELLSEAPVSAEKIYVGKRAGAHCMKQSEINRILIDKVREGKFVVRLKGGDPFIFGRGGEEVTALKEAGAEVEIVPGITSGIGVPTSLGIPLTHRNLSSSVVFVTGHEDASKEQESIDWDRISAADTIVIYMGTKRVGYIVERLIMSGLPPSRPVAIAFGGTLPGAKVITGTLDTIEDQVNGMTRDLPGLIIVGEVVEKFEDRARQMMRCEPKYQLEEFVQ